MHTRVSSHKGNKMNKVSVLFFLCSVFLLSACENNEAKNFKQKIISAFEENLDDKALTSFLDANVKAICPLRAESYNKRQYEGSRYKLNNFTTEEKFQKALPNGNYAVYLGLADSDENIKFLLINDNKLRINGQDFYFSYGYAFGGLHYECRDTSDLIVRAEITGKSADLAEMPVILITKGN